MKTTSMFDKDYAKPHSKAPDQKIMDAIQSANLWAFDLP